MFSLRASDRRSGSASSCWRGRFSTWLAKPMTGILLNALSQPHVIHAGEEVRIFNLEGMPKIEIGCYSIWKSLVKSLECLCNQHKAEKFEPILSEKALDLL